MAAAEQSTFQTDYLYFKNNIQNAPKGTALENALRQYIVFLDQSISKSANAVDKYYIMQERLKYEKKLIKMQGEMDVEMEEDEIEVAVPITIEEMQNDSRFSQFFDLKHMEPHDFDIPQPAVRQNSETLMHELSYQFKCNVSFSKPNPVEAPNRLMQSFSLKPTNNSQCLGKRTSCDNNPRKKRLVNPTEESNQPSFVSAKAKLRQDDIQKGRDPNRFPNRNGGRKGPGLSRSNAPGFVKRALQDDKMDDEDVPEELRNIDPKLRQSIECEILDMKGTISFDDIAGLEKEKMQIKQMMIWPLIRPDLYVGARTQEKGFLLFGPPGTGKTMIGKAVASQVNAKFFSISAASLTSKWHGESEKLVRAMFALARYHQPSIIFIDEIDSLLSKRTSKDDDANRRVKTEFLVQLDGCGTQENDMVFVIGATNRPQEIDEAARRRLSKRLYIPLPCILSRKALLKLGLKGVKHVMADEDIEVIAQKTEGYSGADIKHVCKEAVNLPIVDAARHHDIRTIPADSIRGVNRNDFLRSLRRVSASVRPEEVEHYKIWNEEFGCFGGNDTMTQIEEEI